MSYILSPEGLSPEDLTEKEKVFYAHLKELNAVALGEEYQRPFMLDKKQQTWTGFPLDYVFLVSARSETVSLASLREVKQAVVNHLLYEMTSTVGSRMESFRVDCRQRLRSKDGNGLPTFLSRLGIAGIDLPVRVLKQLSTAAAGADICQTILGNGALKQKEEQVLTQMGLTLSQVETAFGKNLYIQRIHRVSAPLNEEIRDASPSNWLSLIDAKRVALDAIINEMQKGLAKRRQTLFDSFGEKLVESVSSLMTSKNTGVVQAAGYLEQLNQALGLSDDEPGLISTCGKTKSSVAFCMEKINQSESEKLEADIKRLKQEITDAQRGLLKKSLHALGINRPTEIRDQLVSAVEAYYTHECQKQVFREIVSLYKALSERSIDQLNSVRSVAQRFETAQKDFLRKIDSLQTANEFALAEYLREKDEYLVLYKEHVSENDKGNAAQSVLVKLQNDLFTVTSMSKEELTQAIGEVISAEKMVDFVEKLDFTDSFDEKFPSSQEKESALRRSFLRAKPLTIVDANYAKSKTGVEAESRELVIVPKGADESLINLITKTYPVSEDQIVTVSEKRLLVLREEHGFPVNAVTFVRDECASQYQSQSVKERYHITKWAANYPDPIPIVALENDNLADEDVLFLSIGLGIGSFKNDNGGLFYLDDSIPIPLGETLQDAKEKISVDGREGESDREALLRLIAQQERVLLSSLGVKKAFQQSAEKMPKFARELRDIHKKRYEV